MGTGRRLLRGALAVTALGWAAVGLVLALMIVLPTPKLHLLWANVVLDSLAVVVEGYSLLLTVFALVGIALAALARRAGLRRASLVAACWGGDRRALPPARGPGVAYRLARERRALALGVLLLPRHRFA